MWKRHRSIRLSSIVWIGAMGTLLLTVVLGYGGENLVVGPLPVPVVWYLLGLLTLLVGLPGLVILRRITGWLYSVLVLMVVLGTFRMFLDIPQHGWWAVRSSVFFMAAIGVPVGVYLGWHYRGHPWEKLVVLPIVGVIIYTLTFPWRQWLHSTSPTSGAFNAVPILGYYNYFDTATAAVWAALLGDIRVRLRWVVLSIVMLFGLAMTQGRLAYLSLMFTVILVAFVLLGSYGRGLIFSRTFLVAGIISALFLLASVMPISGRLGSFSLDHVLAQMATITGAEGPGSGSIAHRYAEYPVAIRRLIDQPVEALIVGNGLGASIELGVTGIYTRGLHLDYVETVYRAGMVGILWIVAVIGLFIEVVRGMTGAIRKRLVSHRERTCLLMISSVLFFSLIRSTNQPVFFWANSAFPFYLYAGLALGVTSRKSQEREMK